MTAVPLGLTVAFSVADVSVTAEAASVTAVGALAGGGGAELVLKVSSAPSPLVVVAAFSATILKW